MPKSAIDEFPVGTPEIIRTDLRILLDPRVCKTWERGMMSIGEDMRFWALLDLADMSVDDLILRFGKPSELKTDTGWTVVTYARLRLLAKADGKITMLFLKPEPWVALLDGGHLKNRP